MMPAHSAGIYLTPTRSEAKPRNSGVYPSPTILFFVFFMFIDIYCGTFENMGADALSIVSIGLMVALIIIVVYKCGKMPSAAPAVAMAPTAVDTAGTVDASAAVTGDSARAAGIAEAMGGNREYFDSCGNEDDVAKTLSCACDPSTGFPFSKNAYGAPGLDYNSYVLSQGVDNQVIRNHGEFIKERTQLFNEGTNLTGATGQSQLGRPQGDADGMGYVAHSWVGIRGAPFKACVNDPTQLNSDENYDGFRTKRYCF